jgi:hypothetical protein
MGAMAVPKAKTVAYYIPAKTSFSAIQAIYLKIATYGTQGSTPIRNPERSILSIPLFSILFPIGMLKPLPKIIQIPITIIKRDTIP